MIPVPAAAVRSSKSAADGEHMKIKLQTVIDAIEQASDAYTAKIAIPAPSARSFSTTLPEF